MNEKHGDRVFAEIVRKNLLFLRKLFLSIPNGMALHRVLLDHNNKPVDYVFVEVNEPFEELTGLESANIIDNRVTEVLPGIENDSQDWIGRYGTVAITGKGEIFESDSEILKRWYRVVATCPAIGYFMTIFEDITDRKQATRERERLIDELQHASTEIETMRGILPLCCYCKKVRNDEGFWEQVDSYITNHSQADISHGICPACMKEHYPEELASIRQDDDRTRD